jgi:outer membrane protein assembly factor BamB
MLRRAHVPLWLLCLILASVGRARCEDWPTFMHDNQRTGVSREALRPPLALRWVFDSPAAPAQGWALPVSGYGARKNKPNVAHDDAFRVIAVGDTCYFSSSGENRVYAIDAAAGKIRWTGFTGAAPRLAPAYWQDKLYVGADDGVFRCLDAATGRPLWQIDAAPRPELMLGHGRFTSVWPIRAAGIVDRGIAYFTAGLFPRNHVYLYAVDAADGSILWRRQIDQGGTGGYVPQGHILATGDSLFLTSRVAPSRWNKQDGTRIDFNTPFPAVKDAHEYRFYNGGSYAQVWKGKHIVYGRACILAYDPDKVLTNKWGRPAKGDLIFNWFGARQVLFGGETAYLATDDHVLAIPQSVLPDVARQECRQFEEAYKGLRIAGYLDHLEERRRLLQQHGGGHWKVRRLEDGPLKWGRESWTRWPTVSQAIFERLRRRCAWMTPLKATEALILAGDVIYAGGEDRLFAIDAADGKVLWSFATGRRVRGLAVANGRLYASTVDGKVRCFARGAPEGGPVVVSPVVKKPRTPGDQRRALYARTAKQIADHVESNMGYCLVLGGADGSLAAEIAKLTDFHVEVLLPDAGQVAEARRQLAGAGLYGGRVCVRTGSLTRLPYAPYIFNLVIDQGSLLTGLPSAPVGELFRVTKPHGGVAFMGSPEGARGAPDDPPTTSPPWKDLEAAGAVITQSGGLWKITRKGIPGARDWTHNYATAANTYSSEDPHVKGPFGVLWYGEPGPRKRIERHATPPMPLVVGGIMFTIGNDLVMAYDVYNGVRYWEREIPGATRVGLPINTSNLAADSSSLFVVVSEGECLRLNARTGETLRRYRVPGGDDRSTDAWAWVARSGDLLYGSRAELDATGRRAHRQRSNAVFALHVDGGEPAWTYDGRSIDHDGIAVGEGKLFLLDRRLTDAERERALAATVKDASVPDRPALDRKGNPVEPDLRKLVALSAATGKVLWQKPLNLTDVTLDDTLVLGRSGAACMVHEGVVVVHGVGSLGHPHREFLGGEFARRALYAFDSSTGDYLWGGRKGYRKRPIIAGDYVYAEPFAWQLKTGRLKTIANPLSGRPQPLDFHRGYIGCGHLLASGAALFGARGGIGCWNLDDPCGFTPFSGMALACGLCATPAGGVFVIPEGRSGCTCDTPIYTSVTLYPKGDGDAWGIGFAGARAETFPLPVEHVAVNLGGPGYRKDGRGNLWIPYPARVGTGLLGEWLPTYQHDASMCLQLPELHAAIDGTDDPWIFTSGYAHDKPLRFRMARDGDPPANYTVKLYFAEPDQLRPGQRLFDVYLQHQRVLEDFDVVKAAGGPRRALITQFEDVRVEGDLEIRLAPSPQAAVKNPILCGFEAFRQ